jgi:hypothetical protein
MATTTIDTDTELSAVNSILGAIGQAPITTLTGEVSPGVSPFDNPEIQFIFNLLRDANVDTQSEGWHFNTEYHVKYQPNSDGKIPIESDVISLDLHDNQARRTYDFVRRGGFLYDKITHSDDWSSISSFDLDVVRLFEFADLPIPFRRYITYRASTKAATQLVANPNLVKLLQNQEALSRASLMEYECNQGDHSMLQFEEQSTYQTYQPWRNLRR